MAGNFDVAALEGMGLSRRPSEESKDRLGQEDFLALMISQLRNQDPFKPMDSGDFLGQLAQFGTVSGIADVQRSLETLAGALKANQTLQAAALIERDVLVASREGWLPPDASLRGRIELPTGASDAAVAVYDLQGRLVARQPVGPAQGETAEFEWDGTTLDGERAAPGFYELRPSARLGDEDVALEALVSGRVETVRTSGAYGGLALTVTGLGEVDFRDVRGIR